MGRDSAAAWQISLPPPFFGSFTPQIHLSITTTSASEDLKAGHCRCLLGLKARAALLLCKEAAEQKDSENINLSKQVLPSHSPCRAEKQTHLSQEQHIRQANLACVTACLQGRNIPEQEHSGTHLAVYHPLQSFLCTAACRSSHNPRLGSSSNVLSLMLPVNPGGGGGGGRGAVLLCRASPHPSPRMRESCQQAAPGSCRQETAQGSKGLLPGTEKSPLGSTALDLHTPRKQHLPSGIAEGCKKGWSLSPGWAFVSSQTPQT